MKYFSGKLPDFFPLLTLLPMDCIGCYDGVARIWDNSGNLVTYLREHTGPVFSLKWSKSGMCVHGLLLYNCFVMTSRTFTTYFRLKRLIFSILTFLTACRQVHFVGKLRPTRHRVECLFGCYCEGVQSARRTGAGRRLAGQRQLCYVF